MLILPSHRPVFLMPVPEAEWLAPSCSCPKDQFGRDGTRTSFVVTGRLNDGHIIWRGVFESRDDCDAFLMAAVSGTLPYERELWRLPTPEWHPGLSEGMSYELAWLTFVFNTTPTGSNQTGTSPRDWNNNVNAIETIGAGASGGATSASGSGVIGTGGGGGAWNSLGNHISLGANFTFANPGTTTYVWRVGTGGTVAVATGSSGVTAGVVGGDSWFNGATLAGSSCGSKGGSAGIAATSAPQNGGAGGVAASGIGSGKDGGRGGNITNAAVGNAGSGGGGAGGSTAAGANGTDSNATGVVQTGGGQGDPAAGGAGGAAGQNNGTAGTEIDPPASTTGSGGAGGGRAASGTVTAGSGANYGGAGGGCNSTDSVTANSGAGAPGLVALIYRPPTVVRLVGMQPIVLAI